MNMLGFSTTGKGKAVGHFKQQYWDIFIYRKI